MEGVYPASPATWTAIRPWLQEETEDVEERFDIVEVVVNTVRLFIVALKDDDRLKDAGALEESI